MSCAFDTVSLFSPFCRLRFQTVEVYLHKQLFSFMSWKFRSFEPCLLLHNAWPHCTRIHYVYRSKAKQIHSSFSAILVTPASRSVCIRVPGKCIRSQGPDINPINTAHPKQETVSSHSANPLRVRLNFNTSCTVVYLMCHDRKVRILI
jgi:hypothetical protein